MYQIILQLRLPLLFAAGLMILFAGSGCGGSASTSSPDARTDTLRDLFPTAAEVAEVSADSGKTGVSEIRDASNLLGYLVETRVTGRSGPFSIAVYLDDRHVVKRATVVSYPWSRGREVSRRSFVNQFEGKGLGDAIEVGNDVDAVTGATISCAAMARGVRQAIKLVADLK